MITPTRVGIPVQSDSVPPGLSRFVGIELWFDYLGKKGRFYFSDPSVGVCESTLRACLSYRNVRLRRTEKRLGEIWFQFPRLQVQFESVKLFFDERDHLDRILVTYRYRSDQTKAHQTNSVGITPDQDHETVRVADHFGFRVSLPPRSRDLLKNLN